MLGLGYVDRLKVCHIEPWVDSEGLKNMAV